VAFAREATIDAPLTRVFAELGTPARFLGLQPLLTDVREVEGAQGTRAFEATERVRVLGPIALRNRLHVELRLDPERARIEFATRAPLAIRLDGDFRLTPVAAGTRVVESVTIACPRWLAAFVLPQAIRAQEALLANLKRRLEA
jgi:hypothetical protein